MIDFKKIVSAIMLSTTILVAATVAALEITVEDEESELTVSETRFLSDEFRRQIVKTLPSSYSVLTRDQIISFFSDAKGDLPSGYVEIGKALNSEYVTYGSISKLGSLLTLTLGLYGTSTGLLLAEVTKEARDLKDLLEVIREKTPELFVKMPRDSVPEVPPVAAEPEPPKLVEIKIVEVDIPSESKSKTPIWVAIGLDALGVVALGLGFYFNGKAEDLYKRYKDMEKGLPEKEYKSAYDDVKSYATGRNVFYAVGGVLLLAGVTVHIWF